MKKIILGLAVSLGAGGMAPSAVLAQASGGSVSEVCTDPARSGESQQLWDFVQSTDRTEVYLAYLEACGASPLTAEFAAIAREIVVERTSNFTNLPNQVFRLRVATNSENGFSAVYVS